MNFRECMKRNNNVLMEGALGERLKREFDVAFDEHVAMARLIYTEKGAVALTALWNEYIDIARRYQLPFIATTPTRRANRERISKANCSANIIKDNVGFLKNIQKNSGIEMYVGGLMGCKGDAYTGMARAMGETSLPYIISFTIQKDGRLIDGTTIADAIQYIDESTVNKPVCYMTNCVHPRIVREALLHSFNRNEFVKNRFRGIQANTSPLSYAELDGSADLKCSEPEVFAEEMLKLIDVSEFKIWGGCCGTDNRHMECVARRIVSEKA